MDEQQQQEQKHQQPQQSPSKSLIDIDSKNVAKASFFMQYLLLLKRILICSKRNYVSISLNSFSAL